MDKIIKAVQIKEEKHEQIEELEISSNVVGTSIGSTTSPSKSSASSSQPWLPPCRVCGENASGLHYGVNTCEACKGFFRRSLQKKDTYSCKGDGNCTIGGGQRGSCAACRYQKCKEVGMSKDAIKTGRYTHEKKTRDIVEVKRLRLDKDYTFVSITQREKDFEDIIEKVVELDKVINRHDENFEERVDKIQEDFLEEHNQKEKLFGKMRPMSNEEYKTFYATTGVDVDGRKEMMQRFSSELVTWIEKYIRFAKGLPGFKTLSIDEQSAVVKASRFEVWFLCAYFGIHSEEDIFTTFRGRTFHLEEVKHVWDGEYLKLLFKVAKKFKGMKLLPKERALLKAAVVLLSDRVELANPEPMETGLDLLIHAFEYELKKNHTEDKRLFGKILGLLPVLRQLSHWNMKIFSNMQLDFPYVNFHPLIYEMISM